MLGVILGVTDEIQKVLVANGQMTIEEIALASKSSKSKVRRGINKLRQRGLIRKVDKPQSFAEQKWELTRGV